MATAICVEKISKIFRLGTVDASALWDGLAAAARSETDTDAAGLSESYIWALRDISFSVAPGEVLGIIGRNGAGKSTLLKIISRITAPTRGTIKLRGQVSSLLELGTGFHSELSGRDNIFLSAAIHGMRPAAIRRHFDAIIDFADIGPFIDTPIKRYSTGMKARLAFSVAAHLDADILIIDEVLAVGDLEFQKKCLRSIGDASAAGRTVLFVSHRMDHISGLCPRSILIHGGRLMFDGATGDALATYYKYFEESLRGPVRERHDRTGRGRARLAEVEILDAQGTKRLVVITGQSACVRLTVENRTTAALAGLAAEIDIHSATGVFVTRLSTHEHGTIAIGPTGSVHVDFTFDRVVLNAGHYSLNSRIVGADGVDEDALAAAEFTVDFGDFHGTGQSSGGLLSIAHRGRVLSLDGADLARTHAR